MMLQETRDDELESVIKSHSKLNLFAPMPGCGSAKRWLIFDSSLRLRDSFSSKVSGLMMNRRYSFEIMMWY